MKALTGILLLLLVLLQASGAAAQGGRAFPGGATSIRESRGDWVLLCGFDGDTRACNLRQEQRESSSGKMLLIAELVPRGGVVTGSLVLPFGVDLAKGVSLQIDDGEQIAASFQTCVASLGCAILLSFDARQTRALADGNGLKASFVPINGAMITYTVSLQGLTGALGRAAELLN